MTLFWLFIDATRSSTTPIVVSESTSSFSQSPGPIEEEEVKMTEVGNWVSHAITIGSGIGGGILALLVVLTMVRCCLRHHRLVSTFHDL